MTKRKSTKREYDSTRRQAQANETRRHILEAARKLFMERGYAGATAEAIAAEAGVAAQTIYAIFKNKKRILVSLMNVSPATGVEDHTPMPERPSVQAVSQERDQRRQLEMFAQVVAANLDQQLATHNWYPRARRHRRGRHRSGHREDGSHPRTPGVVVRPGAVARTRGVAGTRGVRPA